MYVDVFSLTQLVFSIWFNVAVVEITLHTTNKKEPIMELITRSPDTYNKVRGKIRTKAELLEEIQGRTDGTGEKNETQSFTKVVDKATGETQWIYEIRYGNQVIQTFDVQPHILNEEGELDLTDEQIAEFRAAVKAVIPNYAKKIWKQKMVFAVRNRKNALKNKPNLPVAVGVVS